MLTLLPVLPLPRVLLIEAELAVATALLRGIRRAGWLAAHADTAAAALRLQAEFAPDVALLSLNLPDMDGGALAAKLTQGGGCRVVAMSGRGEAACQLALSRGAHAYIAKPMGMRDVISRLEAALDRAAPAAARMAPEPLALAMAT